LKPRVNQTGRLNRIALLSLAPDTRLNRSISGSTTKSRRNPRRIRVAIISHIHGNYISFEQVFGETGSEQPGSVVCLGDIAINVPTLVTSGKANGNLLFGQ